MTEKLKVENNYIRAYEPLLMCKSILNTTSGVEQQLNLYDKLVFSYLHQQSSWFKTHRKDLFESQDSVAQVLGVDRKTVNRSIKKLSDVGLVAKHKKRVSDTWKVAYSTEDLHSGKFKIFAEVETRLFHTKPEKKVVEVVLSITEDGKEYLTGAQLIAKEDKGKCDYSTLDEIPY